MLPALNHIIVRVDLSQKDERLIGGIKMLSGKRYSENFREKNPIVAEVVTPGVAAGVRKGDFIVCNYNYFDWASPYSISKELYSIPMDQEIFARVETQGNLIPLFGNLFVERIKKESALALPPDYEKNYWDRGVIIHSCSNGAGFRKGDFIFFYPMSDYEIVYNWKGEERRVIKIHKSEIVGFIKK